MAQISWQKYAEERFLTAPTTIQTYNGFIHDYGLLNPLDHIAAVKFSSEQAALALKKALFEK